MTTKLVIAAALCVATLAIAGEKTAPFRHPKAVQAWNRYQFREAKAREAYDREMAAAKAEYAAGLKEAATLAAKAGDAEDLKAISDAVIGAAVTPPITVLAAIYGVNQSWVDVTDQVQQMVGDSDRWSAAVSDAVFGDPAPRYNLGNTLVVRYAVGDTVRVAVAYAGTEIVIH